jgi:hypothetical protein
VCHDDRFEKDSTVFKKAEEKPKDSDTQIEWNNAMTPREYFRKAFERGKQNHKFVQTLREFYRQTYEEVEKEFKGRK